MGLKIFAFVEALRTDAEAFPYAGKRTKGLWLTITGVALAVNIVVFSPLFFLNVIGVVGALVYLVDVRPAVKQYRAGGSQQNMGPYGPW
jgi:asparagine N-glycosylation enzyme membrane subunit Stt3